MLRVNLKSSDLLSFNDLKSENVQLASDLSSAEETIKKQNEEFFCCFRNFLYSDNNATLNKLR